VKQTVCEAAGGYEGLLSLADAWHRRVLQDAIVSHAFSHGYHPQHTERLAAYWAEALGGPASYSEKYGNETSVVRLHSGNGPHEDMDQRAIACFDQALSDIGLARNEQLRRVTARLFRVGHHDYHGSVSRFRGRCPRRLGNPEVVVARTRFRPERRRQVMAGRRTQWHVNAPGPHHVQASPLAKALFIFVLGRTHSI
jgi:hemoglobin